MPTYDQRKIFHFSRPAELPDEDQNRTLQAPEPVAVAQTYGRGNGMRPTEAQIADAQDKPVESIDYIDRSNGMKASAEMIAEANAQDAAALAGRIEQYQQAFADGQYGRGNIQKLTVSSEQFVDDLTNPTVQAALAPLNLTNSLGEKVDLQQQGKELAEAMYSLSDKQTLAWTQDAVPRTRDFENETIGQTFGDLLTEAAHLHPDPNVRTCSKSF